MSGGIIAFKLICGFIRQSVANKEKRANNIAKIEKKTARNSKNS